MKTIADRLKEERTALGLSQDELAEKAKVSQGTIGNVESGARKQPRELLKIAAALGVMAEWLQHGEGPKTPHASTAIQDRTRGTENPQSTGVAHLLTLHEFTVPPLTKWEDLMNMDTLPAVFRVIAPDDALAPKIARGAELIMATGIQPRPNQVVLVRDSIGTLHLRRYGQGAAGNWRALAPNDAYLTLDAERDGLVLLAALKWIEGEGY